MNNPPEDYEKHMCLPDIGQAQMLAAQLQRLLIRFSPRSIALIGCAGGNGLDRIDHGQLKRVVALDINSTYLNAVAVRHASRLGNLELHCADVQSESLQFEPVDLAYAALILEYVDVVAAVQANDGVEARVKRRSTIPCCPDCVGFIRAYWFPTDEFSGSGRLYLRGRQRVATAERI